jgi:hypothetical protein
MLVRFNIDPSKKWTLGRIEYLFVHEVGAHIVQSRLIQERVLRGDFPNIVGFTTVFGPEQYLFEGIAQALPAFLPENFFSPEAILSWRTAQLYAYLMSNAHLRIHYGADIRDEAAKLHEKAPWSSVEVTMNRLNQILTNPVLKIYQYVYGISLREMIRLAGGLSADDRQAVMKFAYSNVLTPDDFRSRTAELHTRNSSPG